MKLTETRFAPAPGNAGRTGCPNKAALRPLLVSASIVLALAAAPARAVDEHHPEAAESTPSADAAATVQVGPTVEKMQKNVREMQSQLERVAAAKTDEERRAALAEHMQTMQANMMLGRSMMMGVTGGSAAMGGATMGPGMMSGMMGPGMMCPGMMGQGTMGQGTMGQGAMGRGGAGGADSAELQRMERRLDMMQMMMEQMMRSRPGQPPSQP